VLEVVSWRELKSSTAFSKTVCGPETLQNGDEDSKKMPGVSHAEENHDRYWNACSLSNLDQLICSPFFVGAQHESRRYATGCEYLTPREGKHRVP
jgi:hypothetical protein